MEILRLFRVYPPLTGRIPDSTICPTRTLFNSLTNSRYLPMTSSDPFLSTSFVPTWTNTAPPFPGPTTLATRLRTSWMPAPGKQIRTHFGGPFLHTTSSTSRTIESPMTHVSSRTLSPPDNTANLFTTSTRACCTTLAYALLPLTNSHSAVSLTTPPAIHPTSFVCVDSPGSQTPLLPPVTPSSVWEVVHTVTTLASVCVQQLTTSLWLCTGTLPTPPLTFSTSSQTTCLSLPISPFISSLSLHAKHTNPSSTSPTSLFTFTPHLVHRISFTILTRVQDSTMYMTDPEYRSPHQLFYFIKISLTITSYIYHPRINLLYYNYIYTISQLITRINSTIALKSTVRIAKIVKPTVTGNDHCLYGLPHEIINYGTIDSYCISYL